MHGSHEAVVRGVARPALGQLRPAAPAAVLAVQRWAREPTATQEVLDSRPSGDADLHALVWGGCAVAVGFAVNWKKLRFAFVTLFGWTVCVEIAQPWFTTMRSRQLSDLLGNCVGIMSVLVAAEIVKQVRVRR